MRPGLILIFIFLYLPLYAIVPKQNIAIDKYVQSAKDMNNIGRLITRGKKPSSCSATLIGKDGNIGVVLTAGHCVNLNHDEIVEKCRHQTISFAPANTATDTEQFPVIGRYALGRFIDHPLDFTYDLGLVFVDMTDTSINIGPRNIKVDKSKIPDKLLVHVVGYGKTSLNDDLKNPRRLAMSTQALLTKKHNHEMLLLDETGIERQSTLIPIGDHPSEGDSGGPVIDPESDNVIGVVSHKQGNLFYSEPLYEHTEWLLAQIEQASRYFIFAPNKSGKFSQKSTWDNEKKPTKFKNTYGEINPIVVIDGQKTLSVDVNSPLYAINILNDGGTLELETSICHIEMLRAYAPTTLTSHQSGILIADEFNVGNSNISIQTKMQVPYALNIQSSVIFNIQHHDTSRGIVLTNNGNLKIEGTLKTHHIHFTNQLANPQKNPGHIYLLGTLETQEPVRHFAHVIETRTSSPGKIIGDYSLGQQGVLSFIVNNSTTTTTPLLSIHGKADLSGGLISLVGKDVLSQGFELTLLSAKELKINPLSWQATYSTQMLKDDCSIAFIQQKDLLKMKVVPRSAPVVSNSTDTLDLLLR